MAGTCKARKPAGAPLAVLLPEEPLEHLRCALRHMELLLAATETDRALPHLVSMVRHLRQVGPAVL